MNDAMTQSLATIQAIRAEPRTILPTVRPILVTDRGAMRAYRDADIDALLAIAEATPTITGEMMYYAQHPGRTWCDCQIPFVYEREAARLTATLGLPTPPTP